MPSNRMCDRFIYGRCPFSALACQFSHSKEHAPLCRMWQIGCCIGATGNACRQRHYYNEMDGAIMQAARQSKRPINTCTNQIETYSSPYRVKVVKEVAKQRKEEVDLETGKRRSWVESTEYEVMDLTGETPVRKTRLSLKMSPLNKVNEKEIEKPQRSPAKKRLSLNKSPLKQVNKEIEKTQKAPAKKRRTQKSPARKKKPEVSAVDPGMCPVCGRQFKGQKGVSAHRRARNSACHPEKENLRQPPMADPAVTTPVTRRNVDTTTPTQDRHNNSIIVLPDTPMPGNRRLSLNRV
eukprot:GFUD01120950.1.p1 GENE.GFUD01120950.1~~GFUD01120950.1.p1  ORF type:complete len:294 (-),score=73.18 GFUD01120950.1:100-981(-)